MCKCDNKRPFKNVQIKFFVKVTSYNFNIFKKLGLPCTVNLFCVSHIGLINTLPTTSSHPITCHNFIVLAYQLQTCCTQPLKLEIKPFPPGLPGFPCQIFIEAETLDGHHQTYSSLHKKPSSTTSSSRAI